MVKSEAVLSGRFQLPYANSHRKTKETNKIFDVLDVILSTE